MTAVVGVPATAIGATPVMEEERLFEVAEVTRPYVSITTFAEQ
jgi:hypothetical protein